MATSQDAPGSLSHDASTAADLNPATDRPRGYTLADEEMERLEAKAAAGDVLDPIALNDPVGQSVEKVILRVGVAVVCILVVGILLAQVVCKNIQLSGIPDFNKGVTVESVENALKNGIVWGGEIIHFPNDEKAAFKQYDDLVFVTVTNTSANSMEQLVSASQIQASALAMNLFRDETVAKVVYEVVAPIDDETGAFKASTSSLDYTAVVLTITWERGDSGAFTCVIEGFDPAESSVEAEEGKRSAA